MGIRRRRDVEPTERDKDAAHRGKSGRRSAYDPDIHPRAAEGICAEFGADTSQLVTALGVSRGQYKYWYREHEEFRAAVKRGKERFDSTRVEATLLRKALGYEYTEDRVVGGKDAKILSITRHQPPDTVAIIFWLTNRQPERWKHQQALVNHQHEHNHAVEHMDYNQLTRDDIEQLRDLVRRGAPGPAPTGRA